MKEKAINFFRYYPVTRFVNLIIRHRENAEENGSLCELLSRWDRRRSKARQWNCDYRPSRVACPHQTLYTRGRIEWYGTRWETGRGIGEGNREREGERRDWIELERNEREVLGAVCWILEINTTYPISFSLVILRTMACVTHVHVHVLDTCHEKRSDAAPIDFGFYVKVFVDLRFSTTRNSQNCDVRIAWLSIFIFLCKINWCSDERGKSRD